MNPGKCLRIIVAETSVIVRGGVVNLLRHLPGIAVHPFEAVSIEQIDDCLRMQRVDILIVNPAFGGWFDQAGFKVQNPGVKCMALVCSVMDSTLLKDYDETVSLYETAETLTEKIKRIQHVLAEEEGTVSAQDSLSQREKEIIVCVVKGMTNKEIADRLFLSIHTIITHRRNIARKLQIHSSAGLAIYAILNKLVELKDVEKHS